MIGLPNGPKLSIFNSDEGFPKKEHQSSVSLIPHSTSSAAFFGRLAGSKTANPVS